MRFCTCASGSRPSTTKSRKHEDKQNEKESLCDRPEVRALCGAIHRSVWLCDNAPVELADAGSVWLAFDQFLASCRHFGSKQDPLWRVPRPRGPPHVLAAPDGGAMGADDARGTREVSSRHARSLRFIRTSACRAE